LLKFFCYEKVMPFWNQDRETIRKNDDSVSASGGTGLSPLEKIFFMNPLREVYSRVQAGGNGILERLLREMRIAMRVTPEDLARIPQTGAVVVVANHPFGILDGAALGATLLRVRPDVKILTNYVIGAIAEMDEHCIYVDPFDRPSSHRANIAGLRRAVSHLRQGGVLAIFPAGEVSHWQFRQGAVTDPQWSTTAARLVELSGAPVVPALFTGRNSNLYQMLGVVHAKLRTIQLPREFLKKAGEEIELRFGSPIPADKIRRIANAQQATDFLRWRTYLLRGRAPGGTPPAESLPSESLSIGIGLSTPEHDGIAAEIERLGPGAELDENRDFKVVVAAAGEIPLAIEEIGRQRELAFREAGEGTGREIDLDRFDAYYQHLILWHKKDARIAGGYRFVNAAKAIREHGPGGLYTTTLFWIDPEFFERTGPMLELGRSFIRRDYQKQYAPLMMMWKGIGRYLSLHPETPVLFGPVSISRAYKHTSRELLFRFFQTQHVNALSQWVRPKRPFRSRPASDWELQAIRYLLDVEEMSSSIAEIEPDRKGVPVLLRQYLKIGGELLAFNVDKDFSDVLDGLVLVDLRKTDPARLETYMGKDGVKAFLGYHAAASIA
jgi:putative hemolysin